MRKRDAMLPLLILLVLAQNDTSEAQVLPTFASLDLKGISRIQNISSGYLEDFSGNQYDIAKLSPFNELLSPGGNDLQRNDPEGNEAFIMPIYRAIFDDGTSLLVEKDANGKILYGELKKLGGQPTLYFVKTQECDENEVLVFSDSQVDDTAYEGLPFGDEEVHDDQIIPPGSMEDFTTRAGVPDHIFTRGDGTSSECLYFKVVKVGVVFDAEFCRKYGGKTGARSRIMLIVAAASLLYENEMCVQLQLVDIYTPDNDCSAPSTFAPMPRSRACAGGADAESFIRYFADWMNENRGSLGLEPDAVFHAFTAFPPRGVLGCAYVGTVCRTPQYAYGVDYMTSNFLSTQSIVFAHELGHNLGARHLTTEEASGQPYIMKASLQNPTTGFSLVSIERILGFLDSDDVRCDTVAYPESTITPTMAPSPLPSPSPPSPLPSLAPSSLPPSPPRESPTVGECRLEQADGGSFCFLPSTSGLFGCIDLGSLIDVKPNIFCSIESPTIARVALRSCQAKDEPTDRNFSNDQGRYLRSNTKKKKKGEEKSNGDNEFGLPIVDDPLETPQELSYGGSNDRGLDSFIADDCSIVGCSTFDNFVCFPTDLSAGQDENVFVLTFSATVNREPDMFTVDVTVKRGDSLSNDCRVAQTVCFEE